MSHLKIYLFQALLYIFTESADLSFIKSRIRYNKISQCFFPSIYSFGCLFDHVQKGKGWEPRRIRSLAKNSENSGKLDAADWPTEAMIGILVKYFCCGCMVFLQLWANNVVSIITLCPVYFCTHENSHKVVLWARQEHVRNLIK